jgi:DNA-binding MarR family transcriptional regulator
VVVARLTEAGSALYQETMPAYQELVTSLMAGLSGEDQELLRRLSRDLHVSLETARDLAPPAPAR